MTDAMALALLQLVDLGGEFVVDRYGRVVVAGRITGRDTATYMRLASFGYIRGEAGRLYITDAGRLKAAELERTKLGLHREKDT